MSKLEIRFIIDFKHDKFLSPYDLWGGSSLRLAREHGVTPQANVANLLGTYSEVRGCMHREVVPGSVLNKFMKLRYCLIV